MKTNTILKTAIASLMSMCIMSAPINTCSADAAAVMLQKFIVISATLNDSQLKIADITGDGNVNVFDLVLMKSMLTGSLK